MADEPEKPKYVGVHIYPAAGTAEYNRELRQAITDAHEQSERSSKSATVSDHSPLDFWTSADKAMLGLCETLALLFGLPFGEDLYNDKPVTGLHFFYLAIGLLFAIAGPMWPWIRTRPWVSQTFVASLSRVPNNPYVWLTVLLILFLYGTTPEIYRRATAPVGLPPSTSAIVSNPNPPPPQQNADAAAPIQAQLDARTSDLKAANDRIAQLQVQATSGVAQQKTPFQQAIDDARAFPPDVKARLRPLVYDLGGLFASKMHRFLDHADAGMGALGSPIHRPQLEMQEVIEKLTPIAKEARELDDSLYLGFMADNRDFAKQLLPLVDGTPQRQETHPLNIFAQSVNEYIGDLTAAKVILSRMNPNEDNKSDLLALFESSRRAIWDAQQKCNLWVVDSERRIETMKPQLLQ